MAATTTKNTGTDELRKNDMMAHLLDALDQGKDIGHYGRLVFAMVARHFLPEDEVIGLLQKDKDFSEEQARARAHQAELKSRWEALAEPDRDAITAAAAAGASSVSAPCD